VTDADAIAKLLELTVRAIPDARGPAAIHGVQWQTMRYLADAGVQGCRLSDLVRHHGTSHAPVSRSVAGLARKKLVQLAQDPKDGRSRRIMLTARGREALESDPLRRLIREVEHLDAKTRARFGAALVEIKQALSQGRPNT
jgi:DNA-binding MarR family transcriptional regulator